MKKKKKGIVLITFFLVLSMAAFNSDTGDFGGSVNAADNDIVVWNHIPTIDQGITGYPLGCEGVSLYMMLLGKGRTCGLSLDKFMLTMPLAKTPETGYMGDPKRDRTYNGSKRTTIYPKPAADWVKRFCNGRCYDISGASPWRIKWELDNGNPVGVYITGGFGEAVWKRYPWGRDVTNNHFLCVVGYTKAGDYIINDCAAGVHCEYLLRKADFERSYGYRKKAVVIR
ncbi:MAG: C39 family peptidase [Lachnospiraceae bacterium]|nr:C39 family peptidase [Lachnospiraceae bacterium]